MSAFRLFSKLNTFYGLTGQLLAGGYLKFYIAGSTTPQAVFGEKALTTNNGVQIALDSSGRPNVDIWGSAAYFVEAYAADNTKQGDADNVEAPGAGAITIAPLVAGQFLTNDGAVTLWATILQLPDPTGNAGKQLGTDGTTVLWEAKTSSAVVDYQVVTAAANTTINLALGCAILLNQAVDITTLAFINPPSATKAYVVSITRVKDATGTARAISNLAALATWPGGVPTLTQTTGAIDELAIKFEPSIAKGRGTVALNLQ